MPSTRKAKANSPVGPVVSVRVIPSSGLVSFTVAFGTLAPDGSETVPDRVAVVLFDCAHRPCVATTPTMTTSSLIANLSNQTVFKWPPLSFIADLASVSVRSATGRRISHPNWLLAPSLLPKCELLAPAKKTLTLWLSARYSTVLSVDEGRFHDLSVPRFSGVQYVAFRGIR